MQTDEDAVLAARAGAAAVILSNHGGRNCDTSRSGIEVLPEVIAALEAEGLRGVRGPTDAVRRQPPAPAL